MADERAAEIDAGGGTPAGTPRSKRGWLKLSCLGCLGVGAFVILIVVGLFGLAVIQGAPERDPKSDRLARSLPGLARPLPGLADEPPAALSPDSPELVPGRVFAGPPGEVILDVRMADLEVVPGPPGQPIRVEADYDAGAFELTEEYEPGVESGWTYKLTFKNKVSLFRMLLGEMDGMENRVRVILPRGVPMKFTGLLGVGETDIDLGGLSLTDVVVRASVGEHQLEFSEMTPQPVGSLLFTGSIGETRLGRIGNASPGELTVRQGIGELHVDARGAWRQDSRIDIRCRIGECGVRLPDEGVNLDVQNPDWIIGESNVRTEDRAAMPGAPTLSVRVSHRLGELRVRD